MKTLLHPDYWVEVPAGEFQIGLSETQRECIRANIHAQVGYEDLPIAQRRDFEGAVEKFRQRTVSGKAEQPIRLTEAENEILCRGPFQRVFGVEHALMLEPTPQPVWVDRFYIARFPVTKHQYGTFEHHGTPPGDLPGTVEEPLDQPGAREVAAVRSKVALQFCEELGGRLPSRHEWEKAARGTDGWLYPWGDEWDPEAGYFYYGQPTPLGDRVDAFPRGVSPYGAWSLAGGLTELVSIGRGGRMGCHARESSAETAWFDHILAGASKGQWVALRPVLDEWPEQKHQGFQAGLARPDAEARRRMGPLADMLLTQYDWSTIGNRELDTLEPTIVALRKGHKADALDLVAAVLAKDEDNGPAWLLKAAALEEPAEGRKCVQRALAFDPESDVAQKMAAILKPPVHFLERKHLSVTTWSTANCSRTGEPL